MGTSCLWFAQGMAGALALFGIALVGWYGYTYWQAHTSRRWPTTSGTVTHAQVQMSVQMRHSWLHGLFTGKAAETHFVVVQYIYRVGGKTYEGYRASPKGTLTFGNRAAAEAALARYAPGKTVEVHYNPQRPEVATLETDTPPLAPLVLGVFMGAMAAVLLLKASSWCLFF